MGGVVYVEFDDPKLSYSYPDPDYRAISLDSSLWSQATLSELPPNEISLGLEAEAPIPDTPAALQVEVPIQGPVVPAAPELQVEVPIPAPNDVEIAIRTRT